MRQIAFGAGLDMKVVVSARLMDEPPRDLLVGIGSNQEVLFVSAVEVNLQVAFPTFPSIVALFR